ncbi:MAG: hypothetical protein SNJ78_09490 [Spirochaetales bacterium]
MNTIPTTFNPLPASYTVVGGTGKATKAAEGLTLVLLQRGGVVDRASFLEKCHSLPVTEILSVERSRGTYELESLASRFPKVRFILFHEPANPGQQINVGIQEALGALCFVLWEDYESDTELLQKGLASVLSKPAPLCITPWIGMAKNQYLPVLQVPAFHKSKLKVLSVVPQKEEGLNLFPYDYCGIYHREIFLRLGGYDPRIGNPYWQKLDFGFRAFLWGERIVCRKGLQGLYLKETPLEDTTPDQSYRLFFLKNLAVIYSGDQGVLPLRKFFPFYIKSKAGILVALREFQEVRQWVKVHSYRFKMSSYTITELWEDPSE